MTKIWHDEAWEDYESKVEPGEDPRQIVTILLCCSLAMLSTPL